MPVLISMLFFWIPVGTLCLWIMGFINPFNPYMLVVAVIVFLSLGIMGAIIDKIDRWKFNRRAAGKPDMPKVCNMLYALAAVAAVMPIAVSATGTWFLIFGTEYQIKLFFAVILNIALAVFVVWMFGFMAWIMVVRPYLHRRKFKN